MLYRLSYEASMGAGQLQVKFIPVIWEDDLKNYLALEANVTQMYKVKFWNLAKKNQFFVLRDHLGKSSL